MKILNAKFLTGNASFLIPVKEAKENVFQYLAWFAPRNRANNQHTGKTLGDP